MLRGYFLIKKRLCEATSNPKSLFTMLQSQSTRFFFRLWHPPFYIPISGMDGIYLPYPSCSKALDQSRMGSVRKQLEDKVLLDYGLGPKTARR
jgi:hypothetical protein